MSKPPFPKGPWVVHPIAREVHRYPIGEHVNGVEVSAICQMVKPIHMLEDQVRAAAHLIAASPCLYAALDAVMGVIARHDDRGPRVLPEGLWEQAQAALAKAKGEQ